MTVRTAEIYPRLRFGATSDTSLSIIMSFSGLAVSVNLYIADGDGVVATWNARNRSTAKSSAAASQTNDH